MWTPFFLTTLVAIQAVANTEFESLQYGDPCYPPEMDSDLEIEDRMYKSTCDYENGHCLQNNCGCSEPRLMVYSERLGACGAPTGSYCDANLTCLTGNSCTDNICSCPNGIEGVQDGGCPAGRLKPCSSDSDCNSRDFLACYEGLCDCKNSRRTVFQFGGYEGEEWVGESCKIRVGESCSLNNGTQSCVLHADCSEPGTACRCKEGYTVSPEGSCRKDFGTPCTSKLEECNARAGLMCKNNACLCIDDDTTFDRDQGACVSYAGESCGDFPLWYESYGIGCTQNADCVLIGREDAVSAVGRMGRLRSCKCRPGFVESGELEGKTCVRAMPEGANSV